MLNSLREKEARALRAHSGLYRNTSLSGHHLPYMVDQRSTSQTYNYPFIAHCVKR